MGKVRVEGETDWLSGLFLLRIHENFMEPEKEIVSFVNQLEEIPRYNIVFGEPARLFLYLGFLLF